MYYMAIPVIMPRQGLSESCIITKWHKGKVIRWKLGIPFTYETDKATFEEESQHSGIVWIFL